MRYKEEGRMIFKGQKNHATLRFGLAQQISAERLLWLQCFDSEVQCSFLVWALGTRARSDSFPPRVLPVTSCF